jgi:hypothetical protein
LFTDIREHTAQSRQRSLSLNPQDNNNHKSFILSDFYQLEDNNSFMRDENRSEKGSVKSSAHGSFSIKGGSSVGGSAKYSVKGSLKGSQKQTTSFTVRQSSQFGSSMKSYFEPNTTTANNTNKSPDKTQININTDTVSEYLWNSKPPMAARKKSSLSESNKRMLTSARYVVIIAA